ncbi:ArdC family protein [Terriglobus roseus]|jgi:antirestriction protein ArdC|uniref:Antirestriction protein ArdC n=1 Tax=Terriglobus roseus TaxID=392734 RepID=A0A1H4W1Z1_9BACT|nr:ArdC-like ssDNA-binding domain-containing protein [Terriglobus roseus]SEC87372.1 Antirestriction protein ArdC [Terriglobus roseus]
MSKPNGDKLNIYQIVTDRIIASLEKGVVPWEKPWKTPRYAGGVFPRNFCTGKPYRGVNIMLLWGTGFSSPFWLTFKQAQELGGSVRKGERSERIVFYKQLAQRSKADQQGEDETETKRPPFMLTYYNVFNVEQCDGLDVPTIEEPLPNMVETDSACEAIVNNWAGRPNIRTEIESESRAYYRPSTDSVHLPARFRFIDTAHYYKTLFHELIHSTGHESRLARAFGVNFGDELYSKEELIAETGAAFLSAIAGIATEHSEENTTAYIQHWISALKQDNRLIVQAAASAQRAVDLIKGEGAAVEQGSEGETDETGFPSTDRMLLAA